ncbi:transposase, MuDR, MULE transposase domain protein [Tanacetum coccineum]
MACSIPHSDDEILALVQKQIDEDMVHQKAILDLALQFDNACTTKEDLRKAYKKCNHIPQESRALIDTFLKEGSDKDYELTLSMYRKATKLEKQMNANGAWVSATNYVNAFGGTVTGCLGDIDNFLKKGKLEHVVAIVKSYSPNALGDLNVTLKDLSGTVLGTIHYKVLDVSSYEKNITVGAAMILANVLVFTLKASKHYLNITKRNVVEIFRKDTVSLA